MELSSLEKNANVCCNIETVSYQLRLDRIFLTTESAENTERDRREMTNSDINRFNVMCVNIQLEQFVILRFEHYFHG